MDYVQKLEKLIQKCWDENPENRPAALEIYNQIRLPDNSKLDAKTIEDAFPKLEILSDLKSQKVDFMIYRICQNQNLKIQNPHLCQIDVNSNR